MTRGPRTAYSNFTRLGFRFSGVMTLVAMVRCRRAMLLEFRDANTSSSAAARTDRTALPLHTRLAPLIIFTGDMLFCCCNQRHYSQHVTLAAMRTATHSTAYNLQRFLWNSSVLLEFYLMNTVVETGGGGGPHRKNFPPRERISPIDSFRCQFVNTTVKLDIQFKCVLIT